MRTQHKSLACRNMQMEWKMKTGLYIGIFDPMNLGHMDIIERATKLVDRLIIAVVKESGAPTEISMENRMMLVKTSVENLNNVQVVEYDGRLGQLIAEYDINIMIRGLRMMTDFENEMNFFHTAHELRFDVETVFICADERYTNHGAKELRDIARNHGDVESFLPSNIVEKVKSIYA